MNTFFQIFKPKSFRTQLMLGIWLLMTILIVSFVYQNISRESNFLHSQAKEMANNRSMSLAASSKVWIMSNDYAGLNEVLHNYMVYNDLVSIAIINMDGKVVAHTNRSLVGRYIADKERIDYLKKMSPVSSYVHADDHHILLDNGVFLDIVQMIHQGKKHIGMVYLRVDQTARRENLKSTVFYTITFTILSLIVVLFFASVMANGLSNKLVLLRDAMRNVRQGNRTIKIDENSVTEVSALAYEFNTMVEALNVSKNTNKDLKERLELAFEGSQDGLWDWNIIQDSVYFSPIWKKMLGYEDNEIENLFSSWKDRVHPEDLPKAMDNLNAHLADSSIPYSNAHRLLHKDGHWVWTFARGKALLDDSGQAIRMVGTMTDITIEKELQLKYSHQAQIIEQTHDSVISTDLNGIIINWNKGSERLFGYTADEMIGKNMKVLFRSEDSGFFEKNLLTLYKNDEYDIDMELINKSGDPLSVLLSLSLLKDDKQNPLSIVYFSQDMTDRKYAEAELIKQKDILDHQAHHDVLTELPNRLLFFDRLSQAIESAKRNKSKLALFFIDLDRFKQINDSLGHNQGDKVLRIVAQRLSGVIRSEDTLARLGGDEFTILMQGLYRDEDASLLAQKILDSLIEPMSINDRTVYVSSSIGISLYPQDDTDILNLLKYADAAMYKAKEVGRNNFQYYSSEMTQRAFEFVALESSFREALKKEEFIVYYQPQFEGVNNTLIGMEALVRWNHPQKGMISPGVFIPLAEETGLIVAMDQWVMKTAMKQFFQWYQSGYSPGILAMNLSIKLLQQKSFIPMLVSLIEETGCKPQWTELEVTESQIMINPEGAIEILNQISDMGIKLALDDFGTGYSSLAYLKRLPVDKLKIDQSFVQNLPEDEDDVGIVKAVILLASSLGMEVIAESVETQEQKEFLLQYGCSNIQGYFYAKPMPAQEIERILKI